MIPNKMMCADVNYSILRGLPFRQAVHENAVLQLLDSCESKTVLRTTIATGPKFPDIKVSIHAKCVPVMESVVRQIIAASSIVKNLCAYIANSSYPQKTDYDV